ncbi:zinc finger bed domain-containing protein ricesleeper 2-like [Gigaspora margarita]|uniref:Zinc finger bed domain-containing protein ricesleeper 2-like n=1 Tax=Gigaspora margarita TaxID=4874 RepID=A0A8H3X5A7_GIGMA|nr:zinc finger bed domain-containing protein ricesleeper 2-like [Gigaspora margarita]
MDENTYFNNNYYLSMDFENEPFNTLNESFTTTASEISNTMTEVSNISEISDMTSETSNSFNIIDETSNTSSATTNLWMHIKRVHLALLGTPPSQCTLDHYRSNNNDNKFSEVTQDDLQLWIMEWIVLKDLSFTIVEEMQTNVQIELQEILEKFAFSLDVWTSTAVKAYMGIIVHYINKDWQLQQKTLDFIEIECSHTGANLANELINIFEFYQDNAFNNDTMICHLESWSTNKNINFSDSNHFCYFAHVVNLFIQAALKKLKNETDKIRNFILKSRSSPQ